MNMLVGVGFLFSIGGWLFAVARIWKQSLCFVPAVTFCGLGLLLYGGGLAGALRPTALLLYAAGLIGAVYAGYLWKQGRLKAPHPGLFSVCFGAGVLVFCGLSLCLKLQHYDNFSHWALLVKALLMEHHFPEMGEALVVFKDYPPGTGVWIYYVCLFLGRSQGVMLLAQNSLIFACFLGIFGIVREKKRFLLFSFLGMGCALLSYLNLTIRIQNLLVDFLLPLLALAAVAIIRRCQDQPFASALAGGVLLGVAGIVKNTGLIFAGIALLYGAGRFMKRRGKGVGALLTAAGLAALPFAAWQYHMRTALAGFEAKFRLSGIGGEALADETLRRQVAGDFVRAALDPQSRALQIFVLCHVFVLGAMLFAGIRLKKRWKLWRTLLFADLMVLGYYGGLLGLYLYSMPQEEALRLAGFERYVCSIMALFAGLLFQQATVDIEASFAVSLGDREDYRAFASPGMKRRYQYAVLVTLILAANLLYSEFNGLVQIQSEYDRTLAGRVEETAGDRWPEKEDNRRWLVAAEDQNGQVSDWSVWYVARYFLCAPDVTVTERLDGKNVEAALRDYDAILVLDEGAVKLAPSDPGYEKLREPGTYETARLRQ